MVGTDGVDSETLIEGTETLTWVGALKFLTVGVWAGVGPGRAGKSCFLLFGRRSNGDLLRTSGLSSASDGFQFLSKLTIGRPGLSLTAVGVGSLGLRSLRRILVA